MKNISSYLGIPIFLNDGSMFGTPSEQLSGDMYCYYQIDQDSYGVFILDVMGHGVSSSLVSMSIRSLLYRLITMLTDPILVINEYDSSI
jgi:sigma-B regulation protein RsbU (phosphoserine phosphatase)